MSDSEGGTFQESISVDPDELIFFKIVLSAKDGDVSDVFFRDAMPTNLIYLGNLKINGEGASGNVTDGIKVGDLRFNRNKTITFYAKTAAESAFSYGENIIVNNAIAYNNSISSQDGAEVIVLKRGVLGATDIRTGLTNNIFLDYFILPLIITVALLWIFRSHIIKHEEWFDSRKKEYKNYKSQKILQLKIAKIKTKELIKKII